MQINVNGQNYSRWEDVPAEVRQQLAATLPDADKNGVPDLFEGTGALPPPAPRPMPVPRSSVNGQTGAARRPTCPRRCRRSCSRRSGLLGPMFGTADHADRRRAATARHPGRSDRAGRAVAARSPVR